MSVTLAQLGSRRHSSTSPLHTALSDYPIPSAFPPSPLPTPLDLSYCEPAIDDIYFDSRQSTPYDNSFFEQEQPLSMTDGSHYNSRFLAPQSYNNGLSTSVSSYTPPPMSAGSSQPQQPWNNLQDSSQLGPYIQQDYRQEAFRSHQRHLSSGSSVGSGGPDSPYTQTASYPYIVDTESQSANSPRIEVYDTSFSNNSQSGKTYSASTAPTNNGSLFTNPINFPQPPSNVESFPAYPSNLAIRHAMRRQRDGMSGGPPAMPDGSSSGQDYNVPLGGHGKPSFVRNMSDVYQDELFNPNMGAQLPLSQSGPSQPMQGSLLSPSYRNSAFNDRLQAANAARSASPASSIARERSPFREESEHAGMQDISQSGQAPAVVRSAAGLRQEQKSLSDAAAYARHQISRHDYAEPKTISPKDALLDYRPEDESKNFSLFPQVQQESATGLKKRSGRQAKATQAPSTRFTNSSSTTFPSTPQTASSDFAFMAPSLPSTAQQQYPFISHSRRQSSSLQSHSSDQMPLFPATLSSMESTKSDGGSSEFVRPPGFASQSQQSQSQQSSQEEPAASPVRRPSDTSANSGTYTCTAPSCTARFDTSSKLYKHRREQHNTRASASASPYATASSNPATSPSETNSTTTPATQSQQNPQAPANNTSRNNQPGPHKCDKINPSTGKPCGTIFSRSYDLTRHEDTIHNNRKLKVRCHYCTEEKTFSRNDALTRHMRVVHPDVEQGAGKNRRSTRSG